MNEWMNKQTNKTNEIKTSTKIEYKYYSRIWDVVAKVSKIKWF